MPMTNTVMITSTGITFVNESDERVFVLFERFGKYFYVPSYDSLWRKKLKFYTKTKSLFPSKSEISADSTEYYVELRDTNSSRMVVVKNVHYRRSQSSN